MAGPFEAKIRAWVAETKERIVAVRNESAERVIEVMQTPVAKGGNMPVKSGFLRASLKATIGAANFTVTANPNPDGSFAYNGGAVSLVIAGARLSETIFAVYTANYARPANYGAEGREGRMFVGLAAQQWQRIVDEVCGELQVRATR